MKAGLGDPTKKLTGNQLNWNQIFYFSEVASCGSFKAAGEKLQLSPSTLSEHVAQLEKDLNVLLFFRHHRKIELTPEGSRLYHHAREMFEIGQRMADVVSPLSLGSYPIAVGLVPGPSIPLAYDMLGAYLTEFGPLSFKVLHAKHSELELGLSKAQFDFGFSDRPSERKDIVCTLIVSSFVRFYVAPTIQEGSFAQLLRKLPLLICNSEPSTRTLVEQSLRDADLAPGSVGVSDYPSVLLDLCQQGLGIGAFSEDAIRNLNSRDLKSLRVPKDAPKIKDELYLLWAKDAENTEVIKRLKAQIEK